MNFVHSVQLCVWWYWQYACLAKTNSSSDMSFILLVYKPSNEETLLREELDRWHWYFWNNAVFFYLPHRISSYCGAWWKLWLCVFACGIVERTEGISVICSEASHSTLGLDSQLRLSDWSGLGWKVILELPLEYFGLDHQYLEMILGLE